MKQELRLLCFVYNNDQNLFLDDDNRLPSDVYGIYREYGYNPKTGEEYEWFELDMSEDCLSQYIFTKVLR